MIDSPSTANSAWVAAWSVLETRTGRSLARLIICAGHNEDETTIIDNVQARLINSFFIKMKLLKRLWKFDQPETAVFNIESGRRCFDFCDGVLLV